MDMRILSTYYGHMSAGITTKAAARTAGRTVATIRHWCRYGAVAAAKVAGRWIIEATSLTHRIQLDAKPAPAQVIPTPAAAVRPSAPVVTAAAKATYRKTSSGEWVVYAAHDFLVNLHDFDTITVWKKNGSTDRVSIARVGKPFTVNGVRMAYGYLPKTTQRTGSSASCAECGQGGARYRRSDSSGIPGTVCSGCSRQPSYMLSFA